LTSNSDLITPGNRRGYESIYAKVVKGTFFLSTSDIFDHNYINFEINIDNEKFRAQSRPNSKMISFGTSSNQIINRLIQSKSKTFKGLVVSWPYNSKAEMVEYNIADFKKEYEKYKKCLVGL
jgi:hypothetical protein